MPPSCCYAGTGGPNLLIPNRRSRARATADQPTPLPRRERAAGQAATQPEPVVRGTILSYHFKLKKKRTNSIQGKSPSVHVRSVGLSLSHTSPQTYNPKTHVPMVLPDTPQTHVVPGTHALVGVVPCTTSTRSTNAQRAAQHMPSLTRFTAPYDGGVEVLVEPPWSKTTCSTW